MKIRKINKIGQSQVIATVLLILLVVVSAFIIMGFVTPFIKNQLSSTDCIKVADKIQIKNSLDYTCYDSVSSEMNVQVYMGDSEDLINGFKISVEFGGSSKAVEVSEGSSEVQMYGGGAVEIPGKNEERTYIISDISSLPDSVNVYPMLKNGKTCESSDILIEVNECS